MFGTALEVVIGLIFVYLMLSLVVSAVNELASHFFAMRAEMLEKGITRLLQDDHLKNIKDTVYAHPVLQGMTAKESHKPSYIPGSLFTLALLDAVSESSRAELAKARPAAAAAGGDAPPAPAPPAPASPDEQHVNNLRLAIAQLPDGSRIKRVLETLIDASCKDVAEARRRIEGWFDASMTRVSGWYKRKMQLWILGVGAFLTFVGNVDSVRIAEALAHDSALRASLVTASERTVVAPPEGTKAGSTATAAVVVDVARQFQMSNLPVGWPESRPEGRGWVLFLLFKLFGLCITTAAITQGAPFWFDMLNRVVNIRSAGKPPSSSTSDGK